MKRWLDRAPLFIIVILLAFAAFGVFRGLAWFEGRVQAGDREAIQNARAVLAAGKAFREEIALLKDREQAALDRIGARDPERARLASRQARLDSAASEAVREAVAADLRFLAPQLGLLAEGPDRFVTDSAGMRRLARIAADTAKAALIPVLRSRIIALEADTLDFRLALVASQIQAQNALDRVVRLELSLEDVTNRLDCRILGLIPCPSRTLTFIVGAAIGAVGVAAAK